jgi:hypothetical protein
LNLFIVYHETLGLARVELQALGASKTASIGGKARN